MVLLIVLGLLLIGTSGTLLARSLAMPHLRTAAQIRQIDTYGFNTGDASAQPIRPRWILRALNRIAGGVGCHVNGRGLLARIEPRTLRAAGWYTITPEVFQGYRVMLAAGLTGLLLLDVLASGAINTTTLFALLLCPAVCWVLPQTIVRNRGRARMNAVDRALPDLIDVLIATVEAGLGFAGSLQLVASRFTGPLGQELRLMLREQSMGLSTEQALGNMLERCDTPSVRAFARAVMQGESLGVSIGAMMRNLAAETRSRRRQAAREQIMKAPVKMLFPLVLLIFPALFLVLLYPAATNVSHVLGGG